MQALMQALMQILSNQNEYIRLNNISEQLINKNEVAKPVIRLININIIKIL